MWTHSWPRRRISSATRCGVITSRRLPRWIGPEGLSPEAATIGRSGARLGNPFFTTDMNMPAGVNLAANASVLGLGVPLTPVTLLFGAGVTTCLVVLGSLA